MKPLPLMITALIVGLAAAFGTYMLVNSPANKSPASQLDRIEKQLGELTKEVHELKGK